MVCARRSIEIERELAQNILALSSADGQLYANGYAANMHGEEQAGISL